MEKRQGEDLEDDQQPGENEGEFKMGIKRSRRNNKANLEVPTIFQTLRNNQSQQKCKQCFSKDVPSVLGGASNTWIMTLQSSYNLCR